MSMTPELSAASGIEPDESKSHFNRWLGIYIAGALSVLVTLVGWGCLQFVEVRDSVLSLKQTVPIQFSNMNDRLSAVEHAIDKEDSRIDALERNK